MELGAEFENNLMRSFPKAPTCCLNFNLNFPEFPNSEVGNLKLRLLVTGVEAQVEVQVGVELEMFETPYWIVGMIFEDLSSSTAYHF